MDSRMIITVGSISGGSSLLAGWFGSGGVTVFNGPPWWMLFVFLLGLVAIVCFTILASRWIGNKK